MTEGSKHKILIIEDDRFIARAYQDGLSRAGFEVQNLFDGEAVSEKLREFNPDLLLLDIILPGKNGFEILEEMKSGKIPVKSIPVIILSNLGESSDIEKGKALGAVDYLVKSNYSMKEVIGKVKFHLANVAQ